MIYLGEKKTTMKRERQDVLVAPEQIQVQKEYIHKIKHYNAQLSAPPLAFVVTYGCQQNENDSERIRGMLAEAGYGFCDKAEDADLILYNTCAVREHAELKVYGNLGALKLLKRKKPELVIGVCGCMMQQEQVAKKIKQKYTHVDLIFGTHTLYTLPQLLWQVLETHTRSISIIDADGYIAEDMPIRREGAVLAYVSIMYGCNNFCSYCIVPYVRGRERSRSPEDILNEIRQVAADGYKEVMLLGQNVNSYGKDLDEDIDFSDLLVRVCAIDGIDRVRFMTSHPKDFHDKLMYTMAAQPKICNQLHLPVQAGANSVLEAMNRRYTREAYLEKVNKVRELIPNITLTTDIIVGFPTETDEAFEQTVSLLREVRFDSIYSFIYSKRSGTPAAELDMALTDEQIHKNFDRLLAVQNEISREINDSYIGSIQEVLVEGKSKTDEKMVSGRTQGGKIVHMCGGQELIGRLVPVKITAAKTWFLTGEII